MKRFLIFLAYYSIVVATVLVIGSFFFIPKPIGYILSALFIPIAIYLWMRVSKPSPGKSGWSPKMILVVFLLSLLTLFGFSLTSFLLPKPTEDKQETLLSEKETELEALKKSNEKILEALEFLQEEVAYQAESDEQETLGVSDSFDDWKNPLDDIDTELKDILGYITIKDEKWLSVDVFENSDSTSSVIATLTFGKIYPFTQSKGEWYEVELEDGSYGWVQSIYLREE